MKIQNEMKRLLNIYGKEVSDKLLNNDFELVKLGQHTAIVKVDDEFFSVWMANSDENTNFYDSLDVDYCNIMTSLLTKFYSIPKEIRSQVRNNIKEKQKLV